MSQAAASAVFVEAAQELFRRLGDHSVSRADVLLMHHMKTLLLLRDTESLQLALDRLPALCTLPPGTYRASGRCAASSGFAWENLTLHRSGQGSEVRCQNTQACRGGFQRLCWR